MKTEVGRISNQSAKFPFAFLNRHYHERSINPFPASSKCDAVSISWTKQKLAKIYNTEFLFVWRKISIVVFSKNFRWLFGKNTEGYKQRKTQGPSRRNPSNTTDFQLSQTLMYRTDIEYQVEIRRSLVRAPPVFFSLLPAQHVKSKIRLVRFLRKALRHICVMAGG